MSNNAPPPTPPAQVQTIEEGLNANNEAAQISERIRRQIEQNPPQTTSQPK